MSKQPKNITNKRTGKEPVLIKLVFIEINGEYEDFNIDKTLEEIEDHLYYSIDSDLYVYPSEDTVKVHLKYKLEYNKNIIDELKSIHTYYIKGLQLLIKKNNNIISLDNGIDIHLAKMSLAHSRGYHAIKIQKTKYPNLYIPFVTETMFIGSINIEVVE